MFTACMFIVDSLELNFGSSCAWDDYSIVNTQQANQQDI
jgi:hypothetical protein